MSGKTMKESISIKAMLFVLLFLSEERTIYGLTADKVRWEINPTFIRIYIDYTLVELKESRRAIVELKDADRARQVFWKLVNGADFQLDEVKKIRFINSNEKPDPW